MKRSEKLFFIESVLSLAFTLIYLKIRGYFKTKTMLDKKLEKAGNNKAINYSHKGIDQEVEHLTQIFNKAQSVFPFTITCLPRSLTLWYLLRKRNIHCELKMGIDAAENSITGHAWLSTDRNQDITCTEKYTPFLDDR